MATQKHLQAAKPNNKEGDLHAKKRRTIASMPKTRAEQYEMAKRHGLAGRSKLVRAELARALGVD